MLNSSVYGGRTGVVVAVLHISLGFTVSVIGATVVVRCLNLLPCA